jgi:acetylglutamate kinase
VKTTVVKIGGAALADAGWLTSFAAAVKSAGSPLVIVHGGGPDITAVTQQLGIATEWHEGRRVTPPAALDVASMVLTGRVNRKIVSALVCAGVDAVGLSGVDGGLLRADVLNGGLLGRVGSVRTVRAALLRSLLAAGHTVVVSPISLADDGDALNVNADDAAAAVASALGSGELLFVTDVPGVREGAQLRSELDAQQAAFFIASGIATGGMRVKLDAALRALAAGVDTVRIGDVGALHDVNAGTALRQMALGAA